MRYVRVKRHIAYQHEGNRMEVIEPGSVVPMTDEMAKSYVDRGHGEYCSGPEVLIRPGKDDVERPGLDPRAARAEQATGRAQRVGAA